MKLYTQPISLEDINAGKRIIRTNIVPHYLPIDESKITTIEVPNFDGEGTHPETVYPEQVVDYWEYDERVEYSVCYALLSFSEYFKLNMQISEAESFTIGAATERYTTMSPKTAKVNQQEDGSYDVGLIFIVDTYIQETYPQFLEGLTLVDTYEPIVDGVTKLIVTSLEPEVIDWTLMQYVRVGAKEESMVLKVSPDLISSIPTEALGLLESLGIQLNIL